MSGFRYMLMHMVAKNYPHNHYLEGYVTGTSSFSIKVNAWKEYTITPNSSGYWYWDKDNQISSVSSMDSMFENNTRLLSVTFGSDWNSYQITSFSNMFAGCSGLYSAFGFSNISGGHITNIGTAFNGCSSLTELDLSDWDTAAVTDIYNVFGGCNNLTHLRLDNWDTRAVTNYDAFVPNSSSLTIDYRASLWKSSIISDYNFRNVHWNNIE